MPMPCKNGGWAMDLPLHNYRKGYHGRIHFRVIRTPFDYIYNGRLTNEFLNIEVFVSLTEAKVLAEQHRIEYNVYRPHSAH